MTVEVKNQILRVLLIVISVAMCFTGILTNGYSTKLAESNAQLADTNDKLNHERHANARILDALKSTRSAVIAVDEQGIVQEWGGAAYAITGWSEDDMLGEPIDGVVPVKMRPVHHKAMRAAIDQFKRDGITRKLRVSCEIIQKSGGSVPVEMTTTIYRSSGKVSLLSVIDRTEDVKQVNVRSIP